MKDKREILIETVSGTLLVKGYQIEKEKSIGKGNYIDLLATGSEEVILVEIKPSGFKLGTPDLMSIENNAAILKSKPEFGDKEIRKIIVSPSGSIEPASALAKDWGILLIESDKPHDIKEKLNLPYTSI